jgi:alpha-beta hydrolase superfamily lysophospholipase
MQHLEGEIQSQDGTRLFLQGWQPEAPAKAVVCLVHGLGEHTGRYAHEGARLAQAGYALLGADLHGHGRTPGTRGHAPNRECFMADIDSLLSEAGRRFPGLPRVLYGHSMGGLLTLNYALDRRPELAGVVATSSGLRTALEQQRSKVAIAKAMGKILPEMGLSSGLDEREISRDAQVVEAYRKDPLVHSRVTFGLAVSLLEAVEFAFDHAAQFDLPLLLVHGSRDRIAYPRGSQEFAALAPNATLRLWDGLYHETHNEPEKEQVLAFMVDWMDARLIENAPILPAKPAAL